MATHDTRIRIPEQLYQRLVGLALKNRRSINAEVNIAIENYLKKVSKKIAKSR